MLRRIYSNLIRSTVLVHIIMEEYHHFLKIIFNTVGTLYMVPTLSPLLLPSIITSTSVLVVALELMMHVLDEQSYTRMPYSTVVPM